MVLRPADLGYSQRLVDPFATAFSRSSLPPMCAQPRIPVGTAHALLSSAVERTGEAGIGLRAACAATHGDGGAIDYAMHAASTVEHALRTLSRFIRLLNGELTVHLERRERAVFLWFESDVQLPAVAEDYLMTCLFRLHLSRLLPDDTAVEVFLQQPSPTDPWPHVKAFTGARLHFNAARRGFTFPASLLALPLAHTDPKLHAILQAQLERELQELPNSHSHTERVKARLRSESPLCASTLQPMADALNTSPRTLSRRLASEGTQFSELVDDVRRQRAVEHLEHGILSVVEIARELGFSRGSAFDRAFKRWTGKTPTEFRRALESGREQLSAE